MCTTNFTGKDGETYQISLSEEGDQIKVFYKDQLQGSISLMCCEGVGHDDFYYHIMDLSLQKCRRKGIGQACLKYHIEIFQSPITAAPVYGPSMDDGSHLIDDGIPFIIEMRKRGIVVQEAIEFEHDPDTDDYD